MATETSNGFRGPNYTNENGTSIRSIAEATRPREMAIELGKWVGVPSWRGNGEQIGPSGSHMVSCQGKNSPWESGSWNYFKDISNLSNSVGKEKNLERGKQRFNGPQRLPRNWQRLFSFSAAGLQEDGGEREEKENVFSWRKKKKHLLTWEQTVTMQP